jgi:hypothetical protein
MVAVGDEIILARMPGYEAGFAVITADSSTFTSETVGLTLTFDQIGGVTYWIEADIAFNGANVGDEVIMLVREDNISGTQRQRARITIIETGTTNANRAYCGFRYTAASTGSKSFVVTASRFGSGNINFDGSSNGPSTIRAVVAA